MRDVAADGSFLCHDKQCLALGVWWIACGLAFAQTEDKAASESPYTLEVIPSPPISRA